MESKDDTENPWGGVENGRKAIISTPGTPEHADPPLVHQMSWAEIASIPPQSALEASHDSPEGVGIPRDHSIIQMDPVPTSGGKDQASNNIEPPPPVASRSPMFSKNSPPALRPAYDPTGYNYYHPSPHPMAPAMHSLSLTPSTPPSTPLSQLKPKRTMPEGPSYCFRMAELVLAFLLFMMLMTAIILFLYANGIADLAELSTLDGVLRQLPSDLNLFATGVLIIAFCGVAALIIRPSFWSGVLPLGLFLLVFSQSIYFWRFSADLPHHLKNLSLNWFELPSVARSSLQLLGDCCGHDDRLDYPGAFCPRDSRLGCRFRMDRIKMSIKNLFLGSFVLGLLSFVLSFLIFIP